MLIITKNSIYKHGIQEVKFLIKLPWKLTTVITSNVSMKLVANHINWFLSNNTCHCGYNVATWSLCWCQQN